MVFEYQQLHDKSIFDDLKAKYQKEIEVLVRNGFSLFSMHKEMIWPYSVVVFFPVYLLMASEDFVRIERPLRITSYHLLYLSEDKSTLAYIYGMGCKFYTKYEDGSWLVSNTLLSINNEKVRTIRRENKNSTTEESWERHQRAVEENEAAGMKKIMVMTFALWLEIEQEFNQSNLAMIKGMGIFWMSFLGLVIYWLIRTIVSFTSAI